jgi:NAD(P)-dependent dehydrogenase (short-subunit alcohol dehydrogenase family)
MRRLEGKVALITGASAGIGRTTAQVFASEGASVVVADRSVEGGDQLVQEITGSRGVATFVKADVSNPKEVKAMVERAVDAYGRLDILFNNAGIQGRHAPTAECTLENWDKVIDVNLRGVFLGMKYAIPHMLRRGGGSIVNNASVTGIVGMPNVPAYCASKGGVVQLTKATALEYADKGIRVNAICPSLVMTEGMKRFVAPDEGRRREFEAATPIGRFAGAEEVAKLALFLASDESSYCTGSAYFVDGGYVAR